MKIEFFDIYGGVTPSRAVDGKGNVFRGFVARNTFTRQFGFFIFKNGVNLQPAFGPGHGKVTSDGFWIATDGSNGYLEGPIPGWNI